MATGTGKHKLLSTGPTEPWSIREKLCLASSVMRSGDQNWVSVSRAIKPFAEPGRPPDWFSQKHCASQYSELLETTETPKRKRGEKGEVVETVEDVIVRKLTAERVEELKKVIKETQEKYRRLKRDAELIQAGHMDSRLDELCNDIAMKKKLEEEEAEVKRKATDAAYQARQAVKTPPRRLPTVMVRSPIDSASPGGDYPLADLTATTMEEAASGVTPGTLPSTPVTSFPGIPDTLPPGSAPLEAPMTPVTDDSPQKKMLGQKATPPPSPLLSELLKKGSLLPTSPRLVNESEMAVASGHLNSTGVLLEVGGVLPMIHGGEMQQTPSTVAASPAASVSQPDTCVPMEAVGDPHTVTVSMDSSEISMIINSIKEECFRSGVAEAPGGSKAPSIDGKEDLDLAEKMDIAVSYTGEELDFETVGDIIAIIEDKASPESMLSPSHVVSNTIEDPLEAETQHKFEMSDSLKEESGTIFGSQIKDAPGEDEEEDGVSEAASLEEPKEEDQGEGYLSEMDNEPPVSESDDGFSIHNATLQSHTLADSIPSSPASSQFSVCSEDQEAIQAQKIWKKAIMLVWRAAANHRYANVFLQPVTDDIAPGYHSIVQRPMDLSTIKKNIENGLIRSTAEFQRDIMLMFQNAVMYNSSDHDVYHMAVEMQRDVLEQIQQFLATQLIMQTSESGISAKSLRGRDSTRKQDASEKDSVPMGSPAFLLSLFDGGTRGRRCAIEADMKMKK
ncbi:bromodomain-containing protein 8 isoform X16 [Ovis canadensis]|uniref:bromodomain-containing protein 8 isoform X16 n=1 Tax=Ovis canadensis TaxID=37174 RepID=UPI003753D887